MTTGLTFDDAETGEETYLGVRFIRDGLVGLATSQCSGNEMEVFLSAADALRVAELLRAAGSGG
ncbi:MAG TPA: hypothetical protein VGK78_10385 [Nocardioides sp.]|uniref:hypothetical protein n=1 Tax=Nocardioides sp. TaxID=35761 RepID=UPI002F3F3AD9